MADHLDRHVDRPYSPLKPLEAEGFPDREPPQARVLALANAVDCSRWLELHDAADPASSIVQVARTFEDYLLNGAQHEE